jgi:hypothetical protein
MKIDERIADGQGFTVCFEAVPEEGEDATTAGVNAQGGFLCVADGCGGLGARRAGMPAGRTEAYHAARIAAECARDWAELLTGKPLPACAAEAREPAQALETLLTTRLSAFRALHPATAPSAVIATRFARSMPAALCVALAQTAGPCALRAAFFWAGDCRGYALTPAGLCLCTSDHLAGSPDPMENLLRDARLSNLVSADGNFRIDAFGAELPLPCVLLTVTDGAYSYLPTPMEFEFLLLSTLCKAVNLRSWKRRLLGALSRVAGDDATLSLACYGFESFSMLQAAFAPRRKLLQTAFITPVRRRRFTPAYTGERWAEYRMGFERCGREWHADWRL